LSGKSHLDPATERGANEPVGFALVCGGRAGYAVPDPEGATRNWLARGAVGAADDQALNDPDPVTREVRDRATQKAQLQCRQQYWRGRTSGGAERNSRPKIAVPFPDRFGLTIALMVSAKFILTPASRRFRPFA
jgi:hypothetical protein